MTRKDLETKSIEKLNSIDEAIELINLLNYDANARIDIEMINKIEEWGFGIEKEYLYHVSYKLYHEDAIKLSLLSEYLGDEFEKYLNDNDIELENWQPSDMEEFFEQYGIELF